MLNDSEEDLLFAFTVAESLHVPDLTIFTEVPLTVQTFVDLDWILDTLAPDEGERSDFAVRVRPLVAVVAMLSFAPFDNVRPVRAGVVAAETFTEGAFRETTRHDLV